MERLIALVDRDGVINRRLASGVRRVDDLEMLPAALEGLALLNRRGAMVAIITNQANLGRGLLTIEDLDRIHAAMLQRISAHGGRVDAVYVCPHTPADGCACRKPEPGMLYRAAREHAFALESAFMIGDDWSDVEAARRAGCRPVLVGEGSEVRAGANGAPLLCAHDLHEAAGAIASAFSGRAAAASGSVPRPAAP
jgi:D-glycero-D-manno-heptose 1,7-bisphosphate phosphatase